MPEENDLQAVAVSNESLTKAQLLDKVNTLENTLTQLQSQYDTFREHTSSHFNNVVKDCNNRIEGANNMVAYLERKLKMIVDLINLEGDKTDGN